MARDTPGVVGPDESDGMLQVQARALGDPTRHRIFRYLADADGPVDVAELTGHFGLNPNAIRQHLAKLVEADLVVETKAQATGPGRPRLVYDVDPTTDSRWGATGPYERLSLLLAEVVRTGESPVEVGRRAGRQHRISAPPAADAISGIGEAMARQGFEPETRHRGKHVDIVLANCPFQSTALADPHIVCALHLGLAEGLADGTDAVVDACSSTSTTTGEAGSARQATATSWFSVRARRHDPEPDT